MNKIQQIFGLDPEYNKKMEEQAGQLHEKALAGKWCCIPVGPNLPGFVTYGGMAVETCSRNRVAGTAIRNSAWADWIRERLGWCEHGQKRNNKVPRTVTYKHTF